MKYIKGAVSQIARTYPLLAGPKELATGGAEDQQREELHPEEELCDFADIMALVYTFPVSDIVEKVYLTAQYPDEYSSEALRRLADRLEEEYAKELSQDVKLQALHSSLVVVSVRAEDHEGRMVSIGTPWHLLLIREYRRAQGMPRESYSPRVLARVFGRPSDKTLAKWLKKCDQQGITAQNWTPEQLAGIVSSRRGPRFRGRFEQPIRHPNK
jgi:hypothetical protein